MKLKNKKIASFSLVGIFIFFILFLAVYKNAIGILYTVTVTSTKTVVAQNEPFTVSWSSKDGSECTSPTGPTNLFSGTKGGMGSVDISGITQNKTYEVTCTYDGTGGGTDTGSVTITIGTVTAPVLLTVSSGNISENGAKLTGQILSTGGQNATERGFNYGLNNSYGNTIKENSTSGFGIGNFTKDLTGLICETTYHYRAYAKNSAGTGTGADKTFTTSDCTGSGGKNAEIILNVAKNPIEKGQRTTIAWSLKQGKSDTCIMPDQSTAPGSSGTFTTPLIYSSTSFTFKCKDTNDQDVIKTTTVLINTNNSTYEDDNFTTVYTNNQYPFGYVDYDTSATISWNSSAQICYSPYGGGTGKTGSFQTPKLKENKIYTITCRNEYRCQSDLSPELAKACGDFTTEERCLEPEGTVGTYTGKLCEWAKMATPKYYIGSTEARVMPETSGIITDVYTIGAKDITDTGATLMGKMNPSWGPQGAWPKTAKAYFRYSSVSPEAITPVFCNDIYGSKMRATQEKKITANVTTRVETTVGGLTPGTTYYYCIVGSNASQIEYGGVASFTTRGDLSVQTKIPNILSGNSVYLNGFFNSRTPTQTWFEYRPKATGQGNANVGGGYTVIVKKTFPWSDKVGAAEHVKDSNGKIRFLLKGLEPSTVYEYRAVAKDTGSPNIKYGDILTFTTKEFSDSGPESEIDPWGQWEGVPYEPPCQDPDSGCDGTGGNSEDYTDPNSNGSNLPDLTVGAVSPTKINPNTLVTFSATVRNQGINATGKNFFGFFQISTTPRTNPPAPSGETINQVNETTAGSAVNRINLPPSTDGLNKNTSSETNTNSNPKTNIPLNRAVPKNNPRGPSSMLNTIKNFFKTEEVLADNTVENAPQGNGLNSATGGNNLNSQNNTNNINQNTNPNQERAATGTDINANTNTTMNDATLINLAPVSISSLGGRSSTTITSAYAFSQNRNYYMRACADKKNPADLGLVAESYENNNCGPWTTIMVGNWTNDVFGIDNTNNNNNYNNNGEYLVLGQIATPPDDAIVRYHEGIEHPFVRQILKNQDLMEMYGYTGTGNAETFAWDLADRLARTFGYVKNGKEIRVSPADIAAYQLRVENGGVTVYEYFDSKIVNIQSTTDSLRNKYEYEYYFVK